MVVMVMVMAIMVKVIPFTDDDDDDDSCVDDINGCDGDGHGNHGESDNIQ